MSQTRDIRDAVEPELSYDPLVDDSDISVKNINGGVAPSGDYRDDPALTTMANSALTLNVARPEGVEATVKNGTERTAAEQALADRLAR
jgi:hypothetical protein